MKTLFQLAAVATALFVLGAGMDARAVTRLEAENVLLRHQLNVALRRAPACSRQNGFDRAILVWLVRLWPGLVDAVQVVNPKTVLRWHRAGFRAFWRWKSRKRAAAKPMLPSKVRGVPRVDDRRVLNGI